MMKFKNYMMGIATVTLLASMASCQNNEEINPSAPQTESSETAPKGQKGYMTLSINLPTASGQTRAWEDDRFNDGVRNEYLVENAYLVVFSCAADQTEDQAVLRSAYELNPMDFSKDDSNQQITQSKTKITVEVLTENIPQGHTAYAFVILNKHNFFELEGTVLKDAAGNSLINKTFAEFKNIELDEQDKDFSNQSFTMTNMPHVHKPGGTTDPFVSTYPNPWTLVKINNAKIYDTLAAAQDGEVCCIIDVERVVAKVQVTTSLTGNENTVTNTNGLHPYDNSSEDVKFEVLGWFVDNTNPKAFVCRHTAETGSGIDSEVARYQYIGYQASTSAPYRMVSATAVHTEVESSNSVYRTYWGVDANYSDDATNLVSEAGKIVNNTTMNFDANHVNQGGRLRSMGDYYYCAENTFDVKHQIVKNTTRAIVATQFNGGQSFYTLGIFPDKIFSEDALKKLVKAEIMERVNVFNWMQKYVKSDATDPQKLALFDVTVKGYGKDNTDSKPEGTGEVTLKLSSTDANLNAVLKTDKTLTDMKAEWATIQADQNSYVNQNINQILSFYETGVAYYQVLIRHFDENETPWSKTDGMTNNPESVYAGDSGISSAKYLGRYGVLRNNWYVLNVTSVKSLGSPTVPKLNDDPDDSVETYLNVQINIMPWAKRVQDNIAL